MSRHHVRVAVRGQRGPSLQVIAPDFCVDIVHQSLLRQARSMFDTAPMSAPFEAILNGPALAVKGCRADWS